MSNATRNAHRFDAPGAELFQAVFTSAFHDHVGTYQSEGKAMTLAEVARAIGKENKVRTVEAWRDGETVPRGADLFAVMAVLPVSFSNRLLSLIGIGGAKEMSPEEISFQEVAHAAASCTEMFIRHMEDGRVDHMEKAEQMRWARQMRDRLDKVLHGHDAPGKSGSTGKGNVAALPKRAGAQ
ncbi:hypothetical protein [Thalassospira sp. UBA1131]|uniref:hypothetical protein n=1 Tax=Thalassospira sp. UBA1131 TaxID=1947672 RepID=UPI0025D0C577|nr:hypothetical protein [Thalassospira sp. UBA1131]